MLLSNVQNKENFDLLILFVACMLQCSCAFSRHPVNQQYFTDIGITAGMDYQEADLILKKHGYGCFGTGPTVGPDAEDGRWWQRAQSLDYEYQACPGPTWQEDLIVSCSQNLQIKLNKFSKKIMEVILVPGKTCLGSV